MLCQVDGLLVLSAVPAVEMKCVVCSAVSFLLSSETNKPNKITRGKWTNWCNLTFSLKIL